MVLDPQHHPDKDPTLPQPGCISLLQGTKNQPQPNLHYSCHMISICCGHYLSSLQSVGYSPTRQLQSSYLSTLLQTVSFILYKKGAARQSAPGLIFKFYLLHCHFQCTFKHAQVTTKTKTCLHLMLLLLSWESSLTHFPTSAP